MISLTGPAWVSEGLGAVPTLLYATIRYLATDWLAKFPLYDLKTPVLTYLAYFDGLANLGIGVSGLLGGASASPSNSLIGSIQSILP
jgi:hypothetical protein